MLPHPDCVFIVESLHPWTITQVISTQLNDDNDDNDCDDVNFVAALILCFLHRAASDNVLIVLSF